MANSKCEILSAGSNFESMLEIPVIERQSKIFVPDVLVPFSKRKKGRFYEKAICFYEDDEKFSEVISNPEKFIGEFRKFQAVISPDCSMYRDAPLIVQLANLYKSRAIGSYYQRRGVNVIPNIRWGSEATYTTSVLPEKAAFLGVAKHSIVAVGSYGCIREKEDRYHFQAGLEAMMETLEPEVVLVYGAMPDYVFGAYQMYAKFVQYDNFIKTQHKGGEKNGHRE